MPDISDDMRRRIEHANNDKPGAPTVFETGSVMTYTADRLAEFVVGAGQSDLRGSARATLKRNVLDSVACAIGALHRR